MSRYDWMPCAFLVGGPAEFAEFQRCWWDQLVLAASSSSPFLLPHIMQDFPRCLLDPLNLALGKSRVSHVRKGSGVVIAKLRSAHGVSVGV
jgi:hypothetical protein